MRDRLGRCKNFLWLPSSVQFKGSVDDCKLLFHIEKNDFQRGFDLKLKASCRQCSRRLNSEEHAYTGKTLFAQIMDFLPWSTFHRIVQRYAGNHRVRTLSCAEQFRALAFAQLTYGASLRDG